MIAAMSTGTRRFFKGLPSFTEPTDEREFAVATESIYWWWWSFLRLSPVLWFARETGNTPVDPAVASVAASCGDLHHPSGFRNWWMKTGRHRFAEAARPDAVVTLALDNLIFHKFNKDKLYLEVPLTIRKQTIISQIKKILEEEHEGRRLDLMQHSNSEWKLHTKRFRSNAFKVQHQVLIYRLLYPDIEIWRIGDRLQMASHHRVLDVDGTILNKSKHALNSLAGRYYYKARFLMQNAERGSFPNFESIDTVESSLPFGERLQADYLAATNRSLDGSDSRWHAWLKQEYESDFHYDIRRANSMRGYLSDSDDLAKQHFHDFISGKTDMNFRIYRRHIKK
jgi:hypothetical protein